MPKRKRDTRPVYRTHDSTRGMDFEPMTAQGKTRLEMTNAGPFRPGKTEQDFERPEARSRVKAAKRRAIPVREHPVQVAEAA